MTRTATVTHDGYAEFIWTKWACARFPVFLTAELGYYPHGWEFLPWPGLSMLVMPHRLTALQFTWSIGPVSLKLGVRRYAQKKAK